MSDDPKTPQEGIPLSTGATEGASDLGVLRDDPVCGPLLEQLEALDLKDDPPDPYETAEVLSPNPGGVVAPAGRNVARAQLDIAAPSPKDPSAGADEPAGSGKSAGSGKPAGSDKVVIQDGSPPAAVDVLRRLPSGHVDAPTVVDRSRSRAAGAPASQRSRGWLWLGALALGALILIGLVSRWATRETVAPPADPSATTVPPASDAPPASSPASERSAVPADGSTSTSAAAPAAIESVAPPIGLGPPPTTGQPAPPPSAAPTAPPVGTATAAPTTTTDDLPYTYEPR